MSFFQAYATCFSELVQCEAVDLKVSLEALFVNPRRQAGVLVLCRGKRGREASGLEAQRKNKIKAFAKDGETDMLKVLSNKSKLLLLHSFGQKEFKIEIHLCTNQISGTPKESSSAIDAVFSVRHHQNKVVVSCVGDASQRSILDL